MGTALQASSETGLISSVNVREVVIFKTCKMASGGRVLLHFCELQLACKLQTAAHWNAGQCKGQKLHRDQASAHMKKTR